MLAILPIKRLPGSYDSQPHFAAHKLEPSPHDMWHLSVMRSPVALPPTQIGSSRCTLPIRGGAKACSRERAYDGAADRHSVSDRPCHPCKTHLTKMRSLLDDAPSN